MYLVDGWASQFKTDFGLDETEVGELMGALVSGPLALAIIRIQSRSSIRVGYKTCSHVVFFCLLRGLPS